MESLKALSEAYNSDGVEWVARHSTASVNGKGKKSFFASVGRKGIPEGRVQEVNRRSRTESSGNLQRDL